jgi:hypothetical protein
MEGTADTWGFARHLGNAIIALRRLPRAYHPCGEPSPTGQYLNPDVDFAFVRGLAIIIDKAIKTHFLTHATLFGLSGIGGEEDGGFLTGFGVT